MTAASQPRREPFGRRRALPLYLTGQGMSLFGDEAYYVALAWAAALAGGPGGVVLVSVCAAVPRAALMLVGGAVADRYGIRKVMLASDAVRMLVMALAAILSLGGPRIDVLIATAVMFGIADAVFMPAAGALPPRLVSPERLQRANGLITFVRRMSLLVGAPVGGLLADGPGVAAAFAVNAVTFGISLVFLALIRLRPSAESETSDSATLRRSIGDGLRGVWRNATLRGTLAVSFVAELGFTGPYNVGMVLLAQERGWGAAGVGYMFTAFGIGAAAAALGMAAVRRLFPAGWVIILGLVGQAAGLLAIALIPALPAALAISLLVGICSSATGTTLITLVQRRAEPSQLGRVMSVVSLTGYSTVPVANALTGAVAAAASAAGAFAAGGGIVGVAAVAAVLTRPVRRSVVDDPPPERDQAEDTNRAST
jgi:MFS family permease